MAHGRVAVRDVGIGPVGLALGSLQIGLRPVQSQFFLVADTAQGVEHVVMLRYGERRVFLLDEVLDEVRCGPVIDCSVAVGQQDDLGLLEERHETPDPVFFGERTPRWS